MMARSVGSRSWRKPGGRAHFGSDAFFFSPASGGAGKRRARATLPHEHRPAASASACSRAARAWPASVSANRWRDCPPAACLSEYLRSSGLHGGSTARRPLCTLLQPSYPNGPVALERSSNMSCSERGLPYSRDAASAISFGWVYAAAPPSPADGFSRLSRSIATRMAKLHDRHAGHLLSRFTSAGRTGALAAWPAGRCGSPVAARRSAAEDCLRLRLGAPPAAPPAALSTVGAAAVEEEAGAEEGGGAEEAGAEEAGAEEAGAAEAGAEEGWAEEGWAGRCSSSSRCRSAARCRAVSSGVRV